jgi:tetratricopeptide (TPR) repeat protein
VPGYDADAFFVQLVRQLGVFSDDFAEQLLGRPELVLETLSASPYAISTNGMGLPSPKDVHPAFLQSQVHEADGLAQQAQFKAHREADALFEAAYAKYAEAVTLQPDLEDAYKNWGVALSEQAKLKTGADAEGLLATACEKYEKLAELAGADAEVHYIWGLALSRRAQLTRGPISQELTASAVERLSIAETLRPGTAAYFLACLTSARGDAKATQKWLERCKETDTLPIRGMLEHNQAFGSILKTAWFAKLWK